jgi:hypothetical protein
MPRGRPAMNKLLWTAVKKLPGGEEALRDMVAALHESDRTVPIDGHKIDSTRGLTDEQFTKLVNLVLSKVGRPESSQRPRSNPSAPPPAYFATGGERELAAELAEKLGWSRESLGKFINKQTKHRGMKTRADSNAVLVPMKRMLAAREKAVEQKAAEKPNNGGPT